MHAVHVFAPSEALACTPCVFLPNRLSWATWGLSWFILGLLGSSWGRLASPWACLGSSWRLSWRLTLGLSWVILGSLAAPDLKKRPHASLLVFLLGLHILCPKQSTTDLSHFSLQRQKFTASSRRLFSLAHVSQHYGFETFSSPVLETKKALCSRGYT